MPRAFIVRPFGVKEGIDFEAVEKALIQPALKAAKVDGATTTEIAQAGNIREDMFRLLVTADLVIADLSIHNANVFYELGVRHGLRPRGTLLMRADVHKYPFDLQTDRYLLYDKDQPQASVDKLRDAITATLDARGTDSPVYKMLPSLPAPSPSVLRVVPQDFREEVEYAAAGRDRAVLRLLAHEAAWFEWASEGLRTVGRAQFQMGAWPGAKDTFEGLLDLVPGDIEANQRLATVYQKLGDLERSSQAIQRVIDSADASAYDRAEAFSLQGSNAKTRWLRRLSGLSGPVAQAAALRAAELKESIERYAEGFEQDLNHFYSGLNALSLTQVQNSLATAAPAVWSEPFEEQDDADRELKNGLARFDKLAQTVEMSIAARQQFLDRQLASKPSEKTREEKMWADISRADHAFLTAKKPTVVATRYTAALSNAPDFGRGTARKQVEIFQSLSIRTEFVEPSLKAIDEAKMEPTKPSASGPKPQPPSRALLFTGHMIDAPGRKQPRFPPTAAAEAAARQMIRERIEKERQLEAGRIIGVAGGACGGDILFHEICEEMQIETRLLLAVPKEKFAVTSVQHGGADWVERYNRLCKRIAPRVLSEDEELPIWLRSRSDYDIWQRNSLWMLFASLALDAPSLTLIALWDGGPADGPGGTKHLVELVAAYGQKVEKLPAEQLKTA